MKRPFARYFRIALPVAGSAILLFSCEQAADSTPAADESIMTEYSDNLSVVMSQNGRRSYHFTTPLLEGYSLAREPYREFRKGVKITTYKNDSLASVDAVLTANYAIYFEKRQLWEAKGNVVVEKSDGKTLYTQQLFWDQRTKKIYSNVDSKIVQSGGRDVFVGEGFESDEEFKDWRFRRMKGRMEVEVAPAGADSVRSDGPVPGSGAEASRAAAPGGSSADGSGVSQRPAAAPQSAAASKPAAAPKPAATPQSAAASKPAAPPRRTPAAPRRDPDAAMPHAERKPLPLSAADPAADAPGKQPDEDRR